MDLRSRNPTAMRLNYQQQAELLKRYPRLYVVYIDTRRKSGYAEIVPLIWKLLEYPKQLMKGGE